MFPTADLQLELVAGLATASVSIGLGWTAAVRARERLAKRVVILGTGHIASTLIEHIESAVKRRYVVAGVIDRSIPVDGPIAPRCLGRFDELAHVVEPLRPTHIVIAADDRAAQVPFETLLQFRVRGVVVEDALDFYERLTGTVAIEALTPDRLALSHGFKNGEMVQAVARVLSTAVAIIGLIGLAPLLAAIAIAIKLDSPGPVFFRQPRIGRDGRPFPLVKFRTMRVCETHPSEWVRDNADRITWIGRWLRRFRLDEIPQLVNVLRGEMNLIGPRPHPICNAELFEKQIAFYRVRSAILPGITGWAQVRHGYANTLEEEVEKMRYDLYYIKNRSWRLDCRIMLETIGVVLWGGGANRVRQPAKGCGSLVPAKRRQAPPAKPRRTAEPRMRSVTVPSVGPS